MATTEPAKQSKSKSKEKERKQRISQKGQSSSDRLKTVVRRLPPNLPEDVFWQSVLPWVTDETATWKEYYQGKMRKRINKENIPSRAYIAFKNEELLANFSREYDGHIFRDKTGNESIAIVEFAPFQKIPTAKGKADSRMGTIEKDEDFISFMESLKEPQAKAFDEVTLETLVADIQPLSHPTTTPLLEALKAEKSAQKDKEAILRNHAHYKDMNVASINAPVGSKRENDKKKSGQTSNSPPKGADAPPSKKAAKKAAAAAKATAASQGSASGTGTIKGKDSAQQNPNSSNSPSKPKAAPPTPKSQRTRDRGGSKSTSASGTQSTKSQPPSALTEPPSQVLKSKPAVPESIQPTQPAASTSRRGRPVLGLGSRHFEAALSGAVGGKSRREREKDKESSTPSQAASATTPPKARPNQVPTIASTAAPPTILQRDGQGNPNPAGIITRPPPETGTQTPREDGAGAGGAGRGHRGRGRGRGGRGGRGG
ncbi:Smg-4/UPF3 family-domain-containing protein [Irpex rosettiformis]|uniref:Smg-4/UPF3 family-domain-containing protein n=1 Tax=Irpex rosettiformis TaxID=378272 RepID=A0ACB8U2P0_9APHY|nr:Smg-4/UPF3 family-domain-containing protein [Irpex rosettiformis]